MIKLYHGNCLEILPTLPENSVDSIVTDPPYGLEFMGKDWDAPWKSRGNPAGAKFTAGGFTEGNGYANRVTPSYGKPWQNKRCTKCGHIASGGSPCTCENPEWVVERGNTAAPMQAFQEWCKEWAREALRVLKPGGHLLAFGGSRTYHRLACAVEDAGFEIRDQIMWLYGSGFPKSLNVATSIDKAARGVPQGGADPTSPNHGKFKGGCSEDNPSGRGFGAGPGQFMAEGGEKIDRELVESAKQWDGWGTALKPAHEPIVVARKPLIGTVVANVLEYGTGALNIDGCRVHSDDAQGGTYTVKRLKPGADLEKTGGNWRPEEGPEYHGEMKVGRWPANIIHDGSEEVLVHFPDAPGQQRAVSDEQRTQGVCFGAPSDNDKEYEPRTDSGSAARFFYCAKASKKDRGEGNKHPTVKPQALMRYLVRLVTPPKGTVLDPFAGSFSTGLAAKEEGFSFIGVEKEEEYYEYGKKRMGETETMIDWLEELEVGAQ